LHLKYILGKGTQNALSVVYFLGLIRWCRLQYQVQRYGKSSGRASFQ